MFFIMCHEKEKVKRKTKGNVNHVMKPKFYEKAI